MRNCVIDANIVRHPIRKDVTCTQLQYNQGYFACKIYLGLQYTVLFNKKVSYSQKWENDIDGK